MKGFQNILKIFREVCVGVVGVRGRWKDDIFPKKSGGTPNPRVEKLVVIPNPHNFFMSRGTCAAEAGHGAAVRVPTEAKKIWGLGGYPQFFESRVRRTLTFLAKMSTFWRKPRICSKNTHPKIFRRVKKSFYKFLFFLTDFFSVFFVGYG